MLDGKSKLLLDYINAITNNLRLNTLL